MNIEMKFEYPNPPTNEQDIIACEEELGLKLPQDYREFLLKYNGGQYPERCCFSYIRPSRVEETVLDELVGLNVDKDKNNLKILQTIQDKPDYLFLIGRTAISLLGIGMQDEYKGKVFIWEHTYGMWCLLGC